MSNYLDSPNSCFFIAQAWKARKLRNMVKANTKKKIGRKIIMVSNDNPANEQEIPVVAEPAAEAAKETPAMVQDEKIYTQKDVDNIVGTKKARWEAKSKRDNERKYEKHNELEKYYIEAMDFNKNINLLNSVKREIF